MAGGVDCKSLLLSGKEFMPSILPHPAFQSNTELSFAFASRHSKRLRCSVFVTNC